MKRQKKPGHWGDLMGCHGLGLGLGPGRGWDGTGTRTRPNQTEAN